MKISFRGKLMLSYLVLLLVMGGSFSLYLKQTLQKSIVTSLQENLLNEARLTGVMASSTPERFINDAQSLAVEAGRSVTARVTFIGPSGAVSGDSEVPRDKLGELENHSNRPEVRDALQTGRGVAIRYSATLRTDMLYVAVPLSVKGSTAGVVRLALPLSSVDHSLKQMHLMLGAGLVIACLLSLVLSDILARVTSRPLRQVSSIAAEIGRGNFRRRLPAEWHDELGDLARIMNDMAGRLEEQLNSLSAERNRLDAILAGMGEGLMVTDADGAITLVNPAFRTLFAVDEDVTGRPLSHISRHPALLEAFRRVREQGCELQEQMTIRTDVPKELMTHWVPLGGESGLNGVVAVFHDISDLKRLEKMRKDFVANVSHELRTPVTVIKGYAETLLEGTLTLDPGRATRFVEIIRNHAQRLTVLINDLLNLSEMESSDFTLGLQPMTLDGTIRRVCNLLERKAEEKGIAIRAPERFTQAVLADQGRLEQVLINLVDNAVKFSSRGGSVGITVAAEDDQVRISVLDTGPGIPPESIPRLFERFYRVDSGRSREEGGTGLGLAIVKHIVQLHGGTVRAENRNDGRGAVFSFTLKKCGAEKMPTA